MRYGSLGAEGLFTSLPLTILIRLMPQKQVQNILLSTMEKRMVYLMY
jgi:hypothetical protein